MSIINILTANLPLDVVNKYIIPFLLPDMNKILLDKREISKAICDAAWCISYGGKKNMRMSDYSTHYKIHDLLRILKWKDDEFNKKHNVYNKNLVLCLISNTNCYRWGNKVIYKDILSHFNPMTGAYIFSEEHRYLQKRIYPSDNPNSTHYRNRTNETLERRKLTNKEYMLVLAYIQDDFNNYNEFIQNEETGNILPSHYKKEKDSIYYPFGNKPKDNKFSYSNCIKGTPVRYIPFIK